MAGEQNVRVVVLGHAEATGDFTVVVASRDEAQKLAERIQGELAGDEAAARAALREAARGA